jgi:phasin family protein
MTVQSVVTASAETGQRAPAAPDPLSAVMAIHRRNIEALLKAQQAVMEGNKALMEHQIECLRSTMEQTMTVAQGIMKEPDVKANFKKRCESIKTSMQGGICNSNILSEVSARFNGKAAQIIQDRLYEAIDESEAVFETVFDSYPHQFIGWMTASKAKESDII